MGTKSPALLKWTHRTSAPQTPDANRSHVQYMIRQLREANKAEVDAGHIRYLQDGQEGGLLATNIPGGDDAVLEAVQGAASPVFRAVISLRGDDAKRLGLHGIDEWHALGHETAALLGTVLGLPEKGFQYAVAYHNPESHSLGHPHIHIDLWHLTHDRSAWLNRKEFDQAHRVVRGDLIHGQQKARASKMRTEARNEIVKAVRSLVADRDLAALAQVLPTKGRIAYGYMPPEVKRLADSLVAGLLTREPLAPLYEKFIEATKELTEIYNRQPEAIEAAVQRATDDLARRAANVVLQMAKEYVPQQEDGRDVGPEPVMAEDEVAREQPATAPSGAGSLLVALARGLDAGIRQDRRISDRSRRRRKRKEEERYI